MSEVKFVIKATDMEEKLIESVIPIPYLYFKG